MSRRYSSSLISKWLTGIDQALWWIHYRIPLWGVRCSWAKLSRCRYPDSNVECKACKAAIRWVCSVKAEDLEEIARVGEEPLPPYPMEEITDWTWAILGLETQRFSQVSQYSKIWTMSIRLVFSLRLNFRGQDSVNIARSILSKLSLLVAINPCPDWYLTQQSC